MTGAMVLGSTGVVTMASGLDSALAGMGAEIADSQQQKEVVKVAPTGYDTVAIAQVDEYVNIRDAASTESGNVVGKLYNNCKAEILGKTDDGWYLIKSGDVTGYVSSDYFVTGSQAEELAKEIPDSFIPGQFVNPANPKAHRETTGPEIWNDTDGQVDIFVAGVGTGGTLSGTGEYLKSKKPEVKVVAVEPETSPVLSEGKAGPHKIQGIGAGFVPDTLNTKVYEEIIKIAHDVAFETC